MKKEDREARIFELRIKELGSIDKSISDSGYKLIIWFASAIAFLFVNNIFSVMDMFLFGTIVLIYIVWAGR